MHVQEMNKIKKKIFLIRIISFDDNVHLNTFMCAQVGYAVYGDKSDQNCMINKKKIEHFIANLNTTAIIVRAGSWQLWSDDSDNNNDNDVATTKVQKLFRFNFKELYCLL